MPRNPDAHPASMPRAASMAACLSESPGSIPSGVRMYRVPAGSAIEGDTWLDKGARIEVLRWNFGVSWRSGLRQRPFGPQQPHDHPTDRVDSRERFLRPSRHAFYDPADLTSPGLDHADDKAGTLDSTHVPTLWAPFLPGWAWTFRVGKREKSVTLVRPVSGSARTGYDERSLTGDRDGGSSLVAILTESGSTRLPVPRRRPRCAGAPRRTRLRRRDGRRTSLTRSLRAGTWPAASRSIPKSQPTRWLVSPSSSQGYGVDGHRVGPPRAFRGLRPKTIDTVLMEEPLRRDRIRRVSTHQPSRSSTGTRCSGRTPSREALTCGRGDRQDAGGSPGGETADSRVSIATVSNQLGSGTAACPRASAGRRPMTALP
jgi:hypothetical protein